MLLCCREAQMQRCSSSTEFAFWNFGRSSVNSLGHVSAPPDNDLQDAGGTVPRLLTRTVTPVPCLDLTNHGMVLIAVTCRCSRRW